MASPIIDASAIVKDYGTARALHGVSLQIATGEFVALVGPSGCGKTTLLKILAGFEEPTDGRLEIEGSDMRGVPAASRPTRMVVPEARSVSAQDGGRQYRLFAEAAEGRQGRGRQAHPRHARSHASEARISRPIFVYSGIAVGSSPIYPALATLNLVPALILVILAEVLRRRALKRQMAGLSTS